MNALEALTDDGRAVRRDVPARGAGAVGTMPLARRPAFRDHGLAGVAEALRGSLS